MKTRNKALVLTLCAVLLVVATVMGTLAYLTAETGPVTNTFTVGKVDIELKETKTPDADGKRNFKMVPGCEIEKDPKVTVQTGIEACWLFVKMDKANDVDNYLTITVADGWTQLKDDSNAVVPGVYYRKVEANQIGTAFSVLANDKVTVKDTVTTTMMQTAEQKAPTLTFKAYACQLTKDGTTDFTAAEAWDQVKPTATP